MKTIDQQAHKQHITRFGASAHNYHQQAGIQRNVAEGLIASLRPWKDMIPEGPILEVGAGTGFLSELLIQEFPQAEIHLTDASEEMIRYTEHRLTEAFETLPNVTFRVLDADHLEESPQKYALIISNFAAQWFNDVSYGLEQLTNQLAPGGLLLTAFPGNNSFKSWYEYCLELGLPFTANTLPDVEEVVIKLSIGPQQIDYYENDLVQTFDSSLDFFRHLKAIGASASKSGKSLSAKQMRLLTNHWDTSESDGIKVNWHVVYLAAKRDG
ncbi:MAG: methyltransferase domain-containing protein [Bacteroidota bacterium]